MNATTALRSKPRDHWLRIARCGHPADVAEQIADYLVAHPEAGSVWHAAWEVQGRSYPCMCAPCQLARGEKLSCL